MRATTSQETAAKLNATQTKLIPSMDSTNPLLIGSMPIQCQRNYVNNRDTIKAVAASPLPQVVKANANQFNK